MRLLIFVSCALQSARAQEQPLVFRNATIETIGKAGRLEAATIVLQDGKIKAVGKGVQVPDGARVIDARGKTIMPGIIDPSWQISVASGSAPAAPRTIVVRGRTFTLPSRGSGSTSFTRVADNFYAYDRAFRPLPRSGITNLNLVTSGYGQSAVIDVDVKQPNAMMQEEDGRLFTAVSNDSTSLDRVRNGLSGRRRPGGGRPSGAGPGSRPPGSGGPPGAGRPGGGGRRPGGGRPSSDESRELWEAVRDGKSPLFATANNAAAILHLLRILDEHKKVQLVLTASGSDVLQTLDELKGRSLRLILLPQLDIQPNSRDRVNVARKVSEAGISFAFSQPSRASTLAATQDAPLFPIAHLVKCGLPRGEALQALTLRPAEMLGMEKTMGSLEAGKVANLLIFDGDPLDPAARLRQVLIQGRTVHED